MSIGIDHKNRLVACIEQNAVRDLRPDLDLVVARGLLTREHDLEDVTRELDDPAGIRPFSEGYLNQGSMGSMIVVLKVRLE